MLARLLALQETRGAAYALVVFFAGLAFFLTASSAHAAVLAPTSTVYRDANGDGTVDTIRISFTDVTTCTYEDGDWAVGVAGSIGVTDVTDISNEASCATDNYIDVLVTTTASVTGGTTDPRIDYTDVGTAGSVVADTNQDAANFTATDATGPWLVTVSPTDGKTNVARRSTIVLQFSEPMNTTAEQLTYTFSNGSTTFAEAWTNHATYGDNSIVTLTPNSSYVAGSHTFVITTAPASSGSPTTYVDEVASAVTGDYTFIVPSDTDEEDTAPSTVGADSTLSLSVTAPTASAALTPGASQEITWSSVGGSVMAFIDIVLSYTDENGEEVTVEIANNTANDGSYTWVVPDIDTTSATISVVGTDLVTTLATGTSGAFTIGEVADDESDDADGEDVSENTGVSPVTGEAEDVNNVEYGDYIKSSYYPTVYFVDMDEEGNLIRRPFVDDQTFFTWQDDFSNVETVTDATLPTLSLGSPMLPKAGVVLVKIQSVNKVYAVEGDGELRWITSEDVAVGMYGVDWADYVIDITDTLFPRFERGEDLDYVEDVDTGDMKTRAEVNS